MIEVLKKYAVPGLCPLTVLILFFCFRTIPSAKLWEGYTVLAVPVEADMSSVEKALDEEGVREYICLENQKREEFPTFAPVILLDDADDYSKKKLSYFFDRDRKSTIFYIPDSFKNEAAKACRVMKEKHQISPVLDTTSRFPWITSFVCILLALSFLAFSSNREIYFLGAFFSIAFIASNPFYINGAAVCIGLYGYFLLQKVWRRKGFVKYLLKNPFAIVFVTVPVLLTFFVSFKSGVFYILALAGTFASLFITSRIEDDYESSLRFCPVPIRPARYMGVTSCRTMRTMMFSSMAIFALIIFFFVSVPFSSAGAKSSSSSDGVLLLPGPVEYTGTSPDFPGIDDYVIWKWNKTTESYRSIRDTDISYPKEGDTVSIPRYRRTENGIQSFTEIAFTFDKAFREGVISGIDTLGYPAIEKLWKNQRRKFSVSYASQAGEHLSTFSLVILILSMFVPLGMTVYYILGWKKN